MFEVTTHISEPENEPIRSYEKGSRDREMLKKALEELWNECIDIPLILGGKEVRTGETGQMICPHNHKKVLATYHKAGQRDVLSAIENALNAKRKWEEMSLKERAAILSKAADLISNKYRYVLNAATMLGQSKNAFQAEIDSACETIDFLRFNAWYASQINQIQPKSTKTQTNIMDYRPLEGFIFAVSPFNFTSIASNLNMAPVMMGNTTVWKPATTSLLSGYYLMKIFREAGLPGGVVNFIPGDGVFIGSIVMQHKDLAGVHFTGSNATFDHLWNQMAANVKIYKSYPRIVGETGGKNFIFVHPSADEDEVITAIIRGGFEYQGQKCSAAARVYVPKTFWNKIKDKLIAEVLEIKVGDVKDFTNFMNAVIDEKAFNKIYNYIRKAKDSSECEILVGGNGDKSLGYFIEPTLILTENPQFTTMKEEIFGPVVTIYVYEDTDFEETLDLCDQTSPFGLTGAIFSKDKKAIQKAQQVLKYAAGNFYINDKPTGAVVGMQPFGGARASGSNDKAGGPLNLLRWTSPRNIKENLDPPKEYRYPFME